MYSAVLAALERIAMGVRARHKAINFDLQGTSNGFRPCVYNSGGGKADYSKNTAVKILWLVFWVVQQVWLVGFSSVMGQAMFPKYVHGKSMH